MKKLTAKQEGFFSSGAAILVLFTTILDPVISMIIAVAAFVIFAGYKFLIAE